MVAVQALLLHLHQALRVQFLHQVEVKQVQLHQRAEVKQPQMLQQAVLLSRLLLEPFQAQMQVEARKALFLGLVSQTQLQVRTFQRRRLQVQADQARVAVPVDLAEVAIPDKVDQGLLPRQAALFSQPQVIHLVARLPQVALQHLAPVALQLELGPKVHPVALVQPQQPLDRLGVLLLLEVLYLLEDRYPPVENLQHLAEERSPCLLAGNRYLLGLLLLQVALHYLAGDLLLQEAENPFHLAENRHLQVALPLLKEHLPHLQEDLYHPELPLLQAVPRLRAEDLYLLELRAHQEPHLKDKTLAVLFLLAAQLQQVAPLQFRLHNQSKLLQARQQAHLLVAHLLALVPTLRDRAPLFLLQARGSLHSNLLSQVHQSLSCRDHRVLACQAQQVLTSQVRQVLTNQVQQALMYQAHQVPLYQARRVPTRKARHQSADNSRRYPVDSSQHHLLGRSQIRQYNLAKRLLLGSNSAPQERLPSQAPPLEVRPPLHYHRLISMQRIYQEVVLASSAIRHASLFSPQPASALLQRLQ